MNCGQVHYQDNIGAKSNNDIDWKYGELVRKTPRNGWICMVYG